MGNIFAGCCGCCLPEDEETRLLREEVCAAVALPEDIDAAHRNRGGLGAARERARIAAEQRQHLFDSSAGGRAAHKAQAKMRQQSAADERSAQQRIQDWNS